MATKRWNGKPYGTGEAVESEALEHVGMRLVPFRSLMDDPDHSEARPRRR